MNTSYYLDVMLRSSEIAHDIYARLLVAVHYRIKAGDVLAVAWPDWSNDHGEFGFLFRIFGSEIALAEYSRGIVVLQNHDLIRLFPILSTPQVAKRVVFCRDRSMDHFSPSVAKRLERRAKLRSEIYSPKAVPQRKCHYLPVQSSSTQEKFNLFIRREIVDADQSGGHQYGLGYAVPDF